MAMLAAVRVRGRARLREDIDATLRMLRLTRVNYCSLLPDNETSRGMLHKVKDFITWGPVDGEDIALLLRSRGELVGRKKITDDYMKGTRFGSTEAFAQALATSEARLEDLPGLRLFFRLHPPRKGHGGIKRSVKEGGALGARGNIKDLLYRMR